jgi:ribosomal protein L16 Arg81 hydroxylase
MYIPTFAELVGAEDEFFASYFNQRPLLRRNALRGDPRGMLSVAELDRILHLEVIRPPYLRLTKQDAGIPEAAYTQMIRVQGATITDSVAPEKVYEHFRTGATITWNSLNHFSPSLRALTRMLSEKFAVRSDVVAFLTPAGKQGFTPHHDPVDLFIIQLEGTKYWRLWNPPPVRRGDIGHYKLEDLGEPVVDVSLQPGDVLYLPYNTPHVAVAEDQVSLHLSVMVRPRMWSELLRLAVDELVEDERFWQFPYLDEDDLASCSAALADKVDQLVQRLQDMDTEVVLNRLMLLGRRAEGSSQGNQFELTAAIDAITPTTRLKRTTVPLSFHDTVDGKTRTKVNGHTIAVPAAIAETLRRMGATDEIPAEALFPDVTGDRSVKAAQNLARLGVLTIART